MPGFDRTGPSGAGPMTGGMRGVCTGFGRRGAGGGRGWRNRFFSTGLTGWQRGFRGFDPDLDVDLGPETQLETLKARAGYFEKILDGIKQRIQKLESGT
ncbi:MAG: DUF5320 domain-containing protein [Deltaproteobacteria bacterium]|nr:DUF5320 domain-containing protein [Deltaproteobacteria bacterium]